MLTLPADEDPLEVPRLRIVVASSKAPMDRRLLLALPTREAKFFFSCGGVDPRSASSLVEVMPTCERGRCRECDGYLIAGSLVFLCTRTHIRSLCHRGKVQSVFGRRADLMRRLNLNSGSLDGQRLLGFWSVSVH